MAIAAVAIVAMVVLWPDVQRGAARQEPLQRQGRQHGRATVTKVDPFKCNSRRRGTGRRSSVKGDCAHVDGHGPRRHANVRARRVPLQGRHHARRRHLGDPNPPAGQDGDLRVPRLPARRAARWRWRRSSRCWWWRSPGGAGCSRMVGIGVTLLARHQVHAAGVPGRRVAAGRGGGRRRRSIMIVVLYLAHGISIRTTSALFGTLVGIAMTAAIGLAATGWSHLSGVGSEDDQRLIATVPDISPVGDRGRHMVIAGLGVLNDVTVTQASAVWEMRALKPAARGAQLFASAMRIGRDHIASSDLHAGVRVCGVGDDDPAAEHGLPARARRASPRPRRSPTEIVRTLVGAIGLVLAVPITTLFAVWLAPRPSDEADPPPETPPRRRPGGAARAIGLISWVPIGTPGCCSSHSAAGRAAAPRGSGSSSGSCRGPAAGS